MTEQQALDRPPTLRRWTDAPSPDTVAKPDRGSVVEVIRLHLNPPHVRALGIMEVFFSRAVAELMSWLKPRISVHMTADPTGKTSRKRLQAADLLLTPDIVDGLPAWTRGEGKPKSSSSPTVPRPKVNLFAPENLGAHDVPKDPHAIRIAWGKHIERTDEDTGERTESWDVTHLDPKFTLQQLLIKVYSPPSASLLPSVSRASVGQETAQQLTSHLMLVDSGEVALAAFPSTDERNPLMRRERWTDALETICRRATPFPYERARDVRPGVYADDDKAGDRLVNTDPVWRTVALSPEPKLLPLLFVTGSAVRLYRRIWQPEPGKTARGTYAAIPVSDGVLELLSAADRQRCLWWQQPDRMASFDPMGDAPRLTRRTSALIIPLSYGRGRTERRVFPALARLPVQWTRVAHRTYRRGEDRDKHFLQLTIGYGAPTPVPKRILGIHFGLKNIYYWACIEDHGSGTEPIVVAEGTKVGNPVLEKDLAEKKRLEWDQKKGRWVGGKAYNRQLRGSTHEVVDEALRLAQSLALPDAPVGLGIERIRWVQKGAGSAEANRRFSAWNYGQLRTALDYKGPPAGVRVVGEVFLKKSDREQEDAEQARRVARATLQRLRDQQRRAAAAERRRQQAELSDHSDTEDT